MIDPDMKRSRMSGRFFPAMPAAAQQPQQTPPYSLLGFKVGCGFANGLSVFFDGPILTDERSVK